jgi:hypothetical protein
MWSFINFVLHQMLLWLWTGHVCRDGRDGKCIPEEKRPLGSPRLRYEATIRMGLREIGWGDVD